MNKKAIEHAVLAIVLVVGIAGVALSLYSMSIQGPATPIRIQSQVVFEPAVQCQEDCDDSDPNINPDADESPDSDNCQDGKDNDCDGKIDCDDPGCNKDLNCGSCKGECQCDFGDSCDCPCQNAQNHICIPDQHGHHCVECTDCSGCVDTSSSCTIDDDCTDPQFPKCDPVEHKCSHSTSGNVHGNPAPICNVANPCSDNDQGAQQCRPRKEEDECESTILCSQACESDQDCGQCEKCEIIIIGSITPQQTGTCVPAPEKCPPPHKSGGGGGVTQTQETCCAPCHDNPQDRCEGRVSISDGGCHQSTNKRCGRLESETIPVEAAPPQEQQAQGGGYFSQLPARNSPPELPRGAGSASQQSLAGQASQAQQASQRLPQAQGALAQESSATPSAIAVLFLLGIFIGVYAYLNRQQIGSFFKKEEAKVDPVVKKIEHEWKQITKPHKAKRRHK